MLNNAVTVGTPTSTGGKVLTGSADVKINNLGVSVVGDQATCICGSKKCRGVGPIRQGRPRNIKVGNKLIAMKDDPVDTGCGNCFLLSSGDAVSLGQAPTMVFPEFPFIPQVSDKAALSPLPIGTVSPNPFEKKAQENSSPEDVDDVYLTFSDKVMSIEEFAQETYLSTDQKILDHVLTSNPHLKRSFGQIIEGMPLVISPWQEKHQEEEVAIKQTDELMNEFLTLSSEEQQWFAQHHETTANALLVTAASKLDVHQGEEASSNLTKMALGHVIAGTGAVIAGAQVPADKISKKMTSFAKYSRYVAEKTEGVPKRDLPSNPHYKEFRKKARAFQSDMKKILSEVGTPGYMKGIQGKRINYHFGVGNRQLYRAKDFSKAISGIDNTALYKEAMSFSKMLRRAGWLAVGIGLYGNAQEVYQNCNMHGVISEACGRSTTRNISSGALNAGVGVGIGYSLSYVLAPVTGGVSIVVIAAGALLWGEYGGNLSNKFGSWFEGWVFD